MLFPTIEFGIFFIFVFAAGAFFVPHRKIRITLLVLASYFFYGYWDPVFTLLLFGICLVAYFTGWMISKTEEENTRKLLVSIAVAALVILLGFFKYYGFFAESLNELLILLGAAPSIPFLEIVLPIGISFYTFQALSYIIDVYRRTIPASASFLEVIFSISFFPQLIAGPIVRMSHLLPQIRNEETGKKINGSAAITMILFGLFKKIVIANYLATELVNPVFDDPHAFSGIEVLLAVYGYAAQIYCDFSAYSDIAIGIALLLGFSYPPNFDQPYRSASPTEFWQRWHISLSTWLRDYLYFFFALSFKGKYKAYFALFFTMAIGGLWHGAAWTFVLWGVLHGLALIVHRIYQSLTAGREKTQAGKTAAIFFTFHFVALTWIFFRSDSFSAAADVITAVFAFEHPLQLLTPFVGILLMIGIGINFLPKRFYQFIEERFASLPIVVQGVAAGIVILIISAMSPAGVAPFIYFQF